MPFPTDLRPRKLSLNALLTAMALAALLSGPSIFPDDPENIVLAQEASPNAKAPASDTTPEPLGNDPATFQARLKKVILESLSRQRIPYKNFAWLAPKVVDSAILALPFSVDVGAQKIVLPVYVINHRYLVTTPLLDIARHYSVVPSIPPPQPIALSLSSTEFDLDSFPSTGKKDAPHLVILFGDEQCGPCRRWNRQEEEAVRKDPSIRFVYIPYPQVTVHRNALPAALFEMCAFEAKPAAF